MITREIPSSGDTIPVLGLGSWQTFDVHNKDEYPELTQVLHAMHTHGAKIIDTSPMYGNAEKVLGDLTENLPFSNDLFYATKVWTRGKQEGIRQMESSMSKMKRSFVELMQIHNLTDYKTHTQTLREWKKEGRIRYFGITHYTDASHPELERVILQEKPDFVQFNYSISSRNAEKRLLQVAADNGVATIINRPFGSGSLFSQVKNKPLPSFALELGIKSWTSYFLKYIISHPCVTCVIPATSNPAHASENFEAANGQIEDQNIRKSMVEYLNTL
jgi:diketogulonate reductase-like aldo/keto reductase